METTYRKELGNNYMVIRAGTQKNEYAYRIISENQIEGLLKVTRTNVDGLVDYYYEINGKTSLDRFYLRKVVEYEDLKSIMMAIARLPELLDEYLIDKSYVVLNPEMIFIGGKGDEVYFTLYPDAKGDYYAGIKEVSAFFLSKLNHEDKRCVTAGYGIFEVAGRESFGMEEIVELFGCEGEVHDKGFEDEILAFNEEEYDIDIEDDDIFETGEMEDFDDEFEGGLKRLSDLDEKEERREKLRKYIVFSVPALAIILAGIFLFVVPAASGLTLGIKIICFVMICVAMALVGLLLKGRFGSEK